MKTCAVCGKGTVMGRVYTHRGMLKKKGGVGRRTVRSNKRRFLPNLQRVGVFANGAVRRLQVCTECIKSGRVLKRPRPQLQSAA
ncbi:MAG: 50S ribosomal protein L28 [Candidatus Omnitrophica bacterium]|nr:50S ribosomal protein L28 [Candidatus Omnitrophota bacterium]